MKLYYFPGACSLADHIVLQWTGIAHETIRMSPDGIKSDEYLRINPAGTVPLLLHDDFVLTENVAILGYIAEQHPDAALLGDGSARGRAEVMRWLAYLNSDVHMAFKPIFTPSRFLPDEAQAPALADQARIQVSAHLRRLDAQLQGRDWLVGSRSIADPYLFVILRWAIRKNIALDEFGNLLRFLERMFVDAGVFAAIAVEEDEME
ncbi:glutathione S-transferase N-terminal domain-containing protein [Lysobacter sp. Root690]|uniref:glutathione S-transferase family protein n=1 Tax=Lysobacter sp. Root690 TaxID=1736588 RepID=UPI0006F622E3|nr:glutathione S-transferase N-terminal domain-containing protein [Lysobacter sp. Root690]KRB07957.1 glutathione S-transferase [Lysobacter sp. Root690]